MPVFKGGQDAGVFIWREDNGVIRTRLSSGGQAHTLVATYTATQPFSWAAKVAGEPSDIVERTSPTTVAISLQTGAGDYIDGMDFLAPAGTGICITGSGTLGNTVFLGAQATPATLPLDLLNNGACGNQAVSIDGAPSFRGGQDAGVFVWREANGVIRTRLSSGGQYQSLTATYTATQPFTWAVKVASEAHDVVERTGPTTVDISLQTVTGDYIDGMDFLVPSGAGVCLRGSGTLGSTVLLGARAVPVTMPVDLLGTGAC